MVKAKIILSILLILLMFATVFAFTGLRAMKVHPLNGDDDDDDNGGDDHNGGNNETERIEDHDDNEHMDYREDDKEIKIITDDNKIEFSKEKPKFKYRYYLPTNTTNEELKISLKYKSDKVVEFVDANNNGMVDKGEILFSVELEDLTWMITKNITYVPNTTTLSSIEIHYYVNTSDIAMEIVFYVSKNTTIVDGGADKVKIDFIVYSWPWKSNNSYLALLAEVEAGVESTEYMGIKNATLKADEVGVLIGVGGKAIVEYSFSKKVIVDGAEREVINSYWKHYKYENETEEDEVEVEVEIDSVVIFPRFSKYLYYDPKVGVEDDPGDVSTLIKLFQQRPIVNGTLVAAGVIAGLLLIVVAIALGRRNREE